jgi:beta-glucanase (GH16 family)
MITLLIAQAATLSATNYQASVPMYAPATRPSFADEFSGAHLNMAKWRYDTSRNAQGWYNHELQYYAANRPDNVRISKGLLIIEARRERLGLTRFRDWGGQDYTSGKLVSRRAFGYGFYQIRAKLPCARGTWPAIWMLPPGGKWPEAGEIDIMEMVGWDPNVVHATLHTAAFNHAKGTQRGAEKRVATSCSTFHDYQLDWRPNAITIGVDGRGFFRVANDQPGGTAAWPFTNPYQLILNLAVGGDWGGKEGVNNAALPQGMEVDYVRFWTAAGDVG